MTKKRILREMTETVLELGAKNWSKTSFIFIEINMYPDLKHIDVYEIVPQVCLQLRSD